MIRVMVVEDEPPIQKSICLLLEEYRETLQVVHTAINGLRALEYLEQNPVDLIFTDIKMPLMSGLALAKEVYKRFPSVTMVIVSGFSEFEFARTALQYGVREYLLKPVSRERMQELLAGLFEDVRRMQTERVRNVLRQMVLGGQYDARALPTGQYGMLLYCEGAFPLSPDEMPSQNRLVWDAATVEREIYNRLPERGLSVAVMGRSAAEKLVLFGAEDDAQVQKIANWLFNFLTGQSKIPITMVVHGRISSLTESADHISNMRSTLHHSVCLFHSAILGNPDSFVQPATISDDDFSQWNKGMIRALKVKDSNGITASAEELADLLATHPVRQARLLVMLEKLVLNCFGETLSLRQMENLKQEIQALVSRANLPVSFATELSEVLETWSGDSGDAENTGFCEEVAAWLRLNHNKNFSNADLSAHFRCPAARLSKEFKACFGVSVSEYVNQFRIEIAQTMMRENKKARIKEIAVDVGFSDQYYFSKIFKKVTGVWPTEYTKE